MQAILALTLVGSNSRASQNKPSGAHEHMPLPIELFFSRQRKRGSMNARERPLSGFTSVRRTKPLSFQLLQ